jgi:hypothetical protein
MTLRFGLEKEDGDTGGRDMVFALEVTEVGVMREACIYSV